MVYHIFKDGTITTDIKGRVAKMSDVPTAYGLLEEISQTGGKHEKTNQRKKNSQRSN